MDSVHFFYLTNMVRAVRADSMRTPYSTRNLQGQVGDCKVQP
jgi:hypothetical protein